LPGGQFDWGGRLELGLSSGNAGGTIWLFAGTSVSWAVESQSVADPQPKE